MVAFMENLSNTSQNSLSPLQHLKNLGNKLIKTTFFVGIPVGIIYIINLPYPAIRRPMSEKAPILLLPSQIITEYHFKKSINLVEQAEQLIDNPTSINDFPLGEIKLQEAKQSINAIPVSYGSDLFGESYGYSWRFSALGFQEMRGRVGKLEAKVFQEKNAQTLLKQGELAFNEAKTKYEVAKNVNDKEQAITEWRSAINNLEEIPVTTFAGEKAQQKLNSNREELEAIIGDLAQTEKLTTIISSAQQFSRKAAELSKNPPHTIEKWTQIEDLWQMAINELEKLSVNDGKGYIQVTKLMAEYTTNLSEIKLRKKVEENSVNALNLAKEKIAILQNNSNNLDGSKTIADIQNVIDELNKVKTGTTSFGEAQDLKLFAQNKLKEFNK
jgi:hypothetical protein